MTERTTDWIQTFSGRQFWPLEPAADDVDIIDIAHALANMCRYAGHVRSFYSVAQHSVLASEHVSQEYALEALLHDASEAYLCDLPRPLKRSGEFGRLYKEAEARVEAVIASRFELRTDGAAEIKRVDNALLQTERRDLMGREAQPWRDQERPLPIRIRPMLPRDAELAFLQRFYQLQQHRRHEGGTDNRQNR